jgi:hypothetical protein
MYALGADLGQARDPTAIAVGEVVGELALGTPYPLVIKRIGGLAGALPGITVVIDATGVGRPVLDQMREQGLDPVPVTITGGKSIIYDGAMWKVPKRSLIRPLVSALESGRLKVAKGLAEGEVLVRELQAFQRKITATGHTAFEGVGAHDDMVIAAALVAWWADLRQIGRLGAQEVAVDEQAAVLSPLTGKAGARDGKACGGSAWSRRGRDIDADLTHQDSMHWSVLGSDVAQAS